MGKIKNWFKLQWIKCKVGFPLNIAYFLILLASSYLMFKISFMSFYFGKYFPIQVGHIFMLVYSFACAYLAIEPACEKQETSFMLNHPFEYLKLSSLSDLHATRHEKDIQDGRQKNKKDAKKKHQEKISIFNDITKFQNFKNISTHVDNNYSNDLTKHAQKYKHKEFTVEDAKAFFSSQKSYIELELDQRGIKIAFCVAFASFVGTFVSIIASKAQEDFLNNNISIMALGMLFLAVALCLMSYVMLFFFNPGFQKTILKINAILHGIEIIEKKQAELNINLPEKLKDENKNSIQLQMNTSGEKRKRQSTKRK